MIPTLRSPFRTTLALCLAASLGACEAQEAPAPDTPDTPGETARSGGEETVDVTATYDRGLDFLLSQGQGGIWKTQDQPDPGFSAIALTNLLERPGGVREGDGAAVDGGLAFLSGALGDDGGVQGAPYPNYMTSVVIMALAASGKDEYRAKIAGAAKFVSKLQFLEDGDPSFGGIGYGSDNTRSDLSNTQYALASLKAAGISEDDPIFQNALIFLTRTQNRRENETPGEPREWTDPKTGVKVMRGTDGGANYRPGDSKAGVDERPDGVRVTRSYGSMTFALLRCYHLAGLDNTDGRVKAAVAWIREHWSLDVNPGMPEDKKTDGLYYYYASMAEALTQAGIDEIELPGGAKLDWREALAAKLASTQAEDGSWVNAGSSRWKEGNPVLATAYALSALARCGK